MCPTLFRFGHLTLHTYGLMIAIGFILAMSVLRRTAAPLGFNGEQVDSFSVQLLLYGLLGARIMYFAVDGFAGLREDPLAFFRIWEGGLVFYGGVAGAFIAVLVYARRRSLPLLRLTDALAPPLLIGHSIGRLGCLSAGCCYGKPLNHWPAITFTNPETLAPRFVPLWPTEPMEAAALALLFGGAWWLFKKGVPTGRLTAYYLCGYAVVRFLMEFLRGDDRGRFIGPLSPSQAFAIPMFLIGLWILVSSLRGTK